jgi:hypothetical protein
MLNFGGQRRTIETGCGWRCAGHPREVNGKFKIHKRLCDVCRESHTKELPKFSNEAANINGSWKGNKCINNQPNQILTTALVDGEQYDIVCDSNNINNAMNEGKFTALNIITGRVTQEPILTKSQKKRQKQKAKKQAEKDKDIITDAVLKHIPNDILYKFCDKYEEDADEDKAAWELAELIAGNMTDEEVVEMLNRLK